MSINLVNVIFGMKVRQTRTEADLTLTDFAAQCDLSPSYVTDIEKGRKYPRADKIMRMAEVLGKDYDEMVSIKLPPCFYPLSEPTKNGGEFRAPVPVDSY
jgi:transcriptional regulator with XRE-family HTH domain